MHKRIVIEKKPEFNQEAKKAFTDLRSFYKLDELQSIRVVNVYDLINASEEEAELIKSEILYQPLVDVESVDTTGTGFQFEYHQGGFNQRADSLEKMIQNILGLEHIKVKHSKMVFVRGVDIELVKPYFINPIESKEVALNSFEYHEEKNDVKPVEIIKDFWIREPNELRETIGIGMSDQDILHTQEHFKSLDRNPTVTEIKMLDTYWSDHCRHTTFLTQITDIGVEAGLYKEYFEEIIKEYELARKRVGRSDKPITLMDLATINMRDMKHQGILTNLENTVENNACSVEIEIEVDGNPETWLLMFKNETHNHPTEIEPFGGASTCLGGAIRDPLSGRATVYQAMRISGSADPRIPYEETLAGKLPSRQITTGAKDGYASYGYQIGAKTGYVKELYHPGFMAKRMELGALVAAVKKDWVTREEPVPGDVILLLGGLTGRDGVGAAVGSSTTQEKDALESAGAEVQKGNPSVERKIYRLFRNPQATRLIKKCNDFGAGGVSVAIGELADGVLIDLDKVPVKYAGLDGTEVAISESQERMAVVLNPKDVDEFMELAKEEDVLTTKVAVVTKEKKVVMHYKGQTVVDIDREFIDTNGADNFSKVLISDIRDDNPLKKNEFDLDLMDVVTSLNNASQKGLIEQFDAGIPYLLGKNKMTLPSGMVSELPLLKRKSQTVSLMSAGYNPEIASWSPFHGGYYAVLESITNLVAMGADVSKIHLTFQEYFERLGEDPKRWGKPFAALLGAFSVQQAFDLASIGGKDSMSGSFEEIDVPPTLISFGVTTQTKDKVITKEFKGSNHKVILLDVPLDDKSLVDLKAVRHLYQEVYKLIQDGKVYSASSVSSGIAQTVVEMAWGNDIGFEFNDLDVDFFNPKPGALLLEVDDVVLDGILIGETIEEAIIKLNDKTYEIEELREESLKVLNDIFPVVESKELDGAHVPTGESCQNMKNPRETPKALILVYEGTTGEYDVMRQLDEAGIEHKTLVIPAKPDYKKLEQSIRDCNVLILPHGYSLGNEPETPGLAMALILKKVKDVIDEHLAYGRLILGIGAGMNSLLLAGYLPSGIMTTNNNGQFINRMVDIKVLDNCSPWFNQYEIGEVYQSVIASDQIRLVGVKFGSTMMLEDVVGSVLGIESVTSEDGLVLGMSTNLERLDNKLFQSINDYFIGGTKK